MARAIEMVMPFDRQSFFPDTTPEDWAPHEGWMKPDALDPAVIEAGANVLVAGTATFEGGADAYADNIARLKGAAG